MKHRKEPGASTSPEIDEAGMPCNQLNSIQSLRSANLRRAQPAITKERPGSRLAPFAYAVGLVLVFAISLYLLPDNTGLGKLLRSGMLASQAS